MTQGGQTNVTLSRRPLLTYLHEGFFALNISCVVWYGLFDLPSAREIFEPSSAPRFQYQYMRAALRINRSLGLEALFALRGNNAPLAWQGSSVGMYFATIISILATATLSVLRPPIRFSFALVFVGLEGCCRLDRTLRISGIFPECDESQFTERRMTRFWAECLRSSLFVSPSCSMSTKDALCQK